MPKIFLLDEHVACRIAAGEVIERPVSVIKELVENAIDAGATSIDINIEGGGIKKIRVVDNGCGISQVDAPLAFQRHATSKINHIEDIDNIHTLGFRGEALPGIAAVSRLAIKTKTMTAPTGYYMDIQGGQVQSSGPVGCPVGTTVTVQDIFFNTPARHKHLKSSSTEGGLINDLISKIALTNPQIRFTLHHNNREILRSPGTGKIIDAIAAIYSLDVAKKMVKITNTKNDILLHGYVGKPQLSRSTKQHITLSINGRVVRCTSINQALEQAYQGLLTVGRHPVVVLLLKLPVPMIDVNVHPSKMEIKIANEEQLANTITNSILQSFKQVSLIPEYSSPAPKDHELPATTEPFVLPFKTNQPGTIGKAPTKAISTESQQSIAQIQEHHQQYTLPHTPSHQYNLPTNGKPQSVDPKSKNEIPFLPQLQIIGQLWQTFIVAEHPDHIYLIDQHAAHERILFEKFQRQMREKKPDVQYLLNPITINLNNRENDFWQQHINLFNALGFALEPFGHNSLLLRGIPIDTNPAQGQQLLEDLLDKLINVNHIRTDEINYEAICMMACKAAIKGGDKMTSDSMRSLIEMLSKSEQPHTCPHGRPTVITVSRSKLDKMFKRT